MTKKQKRLVVNVKTNKVPEGTYQARAWFKHTEEGPRYIRSQYDYDKAAIELLNTGGTLLYVNVDSLKGKQHMDIVVENYEVEGLC